VASCGGGRGYFIYERWLVDVYSDLVLVLD